MNQKSSLQCQEEEKRIAGFYSVPVFRYEDTEGRDLERYQPKIIPPLMDVAAKIGVSVEYDSLTGAYGAYSPRENKIILSTEDPATFYHELIHATQNYLFRDVKEAKTGNRKQ